jgi:hypothetical protein
VPLDDNGNNVGVSERELSFSLPLEEQRVNIYETPAMKLQIGHEVKLVSTGEH